MNEEKDEIVIKLSTKHYSKERLDEIRKAARQFYSMREFVYTCIRYYLEGFWLDRRIEVPRALFKEVAKKAEAEHKTIEEYVEERLRQN